MPRKKINIKCSVCLQIMNIDKSSAKKTIDRNGFYLCRGCYNKIIQGKPLWSKRVHKKRNRPQIKTRSGWVDTHRYIVQKFLGRELDTTECVHHCDKNIFNNKIWNLELMTIGEHTIIHHKGSIRSESTRKKISEKLKGRPSKKRSLSFETAESIRYDVKINGLSYTEVAHKHDTTKRVVAHIIKNRSYTNREL